MYKVRILQVIVFIAALLAILVVQGAIPFVLAPTLGQSVWTTGFSHSFSNDGWFSIYAHNIGAPEPAPIAFGLSGAWPASVFIRLGMHAAEAYTAMAALWLTVAFLSAYAIARHFSVSRYIAVLSAVCWGTMPVIWAHAGYSMLSLGIGLLSFYFLATIKLMDSLRSSRNSKSWLVLYPCAAVISVFMDGYTFMMFAVGSSIIITISWIGCGDMEVRKRWGLSLLPVHAFSFALAYGLYVTYIGRTAFDAHSLDFFRGWGVDLAFIATPTRGIHLVPDLLGWSVSRSTQMFWGDASVWITSFSLPLILAALWAVFRSGHGRAWLWAVSIVTVFGFYMALGPSLKISTVKPPDAVGEKMMDAKYAIASTGSAFLSENLPGFTVMRASYRWGALGVFGAWLLVVLALSKSNDECATITTIAILVAVTLLNLPNPVTKWQSDKLHRAMFLQLDKDVLMPLKEDLAPGEMVAFLPWRNDFMVNYLASKLNIRTYNIGGDKNYRMARENWPSTMRKFPGAKVDSQFSDRILKLFVEREASAVVLPYIDMLWAAHQWPHTSEIDLRKQLESAVAQLAATGLVDIRNREHYAVVRLKSEFSKLESEALKSFVYDELCLAPRCLKVDGFDENTPTKVGSLHEGALHSRGAAGFLVFGPYLPLDAGVYSLVVRGSGSSLKESWVDIASKSGTVEHGKWVVKEANTRDGVILNATVEIIAPVKDVEIRFYVGAQDKLSVKGYELKPVHKGAVRFEASE